MSNTIDNRVVQMEFENKDFESNAEKSISTLDKLKQALKLDGSDSSLSKAEKALGRLDLSTLSSGIGAVSDRFSALGIIGMTAIQNITNKVVDLGMHLANDLVIAPVSQGFQEYELKMGSIQTIMASTGASIGVVNGYLEDLNTYSDKTIYSFSDMTSNIGKFTNAGVELDTAVAAIKGISNEAALAGANSNEASRAMYNFAQALSAGYVKLIDWKSIENANMATKDFKQQLIDTAVELGNIEKTADGYYKVLTTNAQGSTMDGVISATKNFNDSLSYQWMTTDVLTKTLGKYANENTEIGKKAYEAATKVKTFTQLMDTLKEAVGSGWSKTFELFIGDFEQARDLFTSISDVVGGFIDKQSSARNSFLEAVLGGNTQEFQNTADGLREETQLLKHRNNAMDSNVVTIDKLRASYDNLNGRDLIIKSLANTFKFLGSVMDNIKASFDAVFEPLKETTVYKALGDIYNFTKNLTLSGESAGKLRSIFTGLFSAVDLVRNAFVSVGKVLSPLLKYVGMFAQLIFDLAARFGDYITKVRESVNANDTFFKFFSDKFQKLKKIASDVIEKFEKLTGIDIHFPTADEVVAVLGKIKEQATKAFDTLKSKIGVVKDELKILKDRFEKFAGIKLKLPSFDTFAKAIGKIKEFLSPAVPILKKVGDGFKKIFNNLKPSNQQLAEGASRVLTTLGNALKFIWDIAKKVGSKLKDLFSLIGNGLKNLLGGEVTFDSIFNAAKGAGGVGIIFTIFEKLRKSMSGANKGGGFMDSIKDVIEGVTGAFESLQNRLNAGALTQIAIAVGVLTAALVVLAAIDGKTLAKSLGAISTMLTQLVTAMVVLTHATSGFSFFDAIKANQLTSGMTSMAAAILILSFAMKNLGSLDWDQIAKGIVTIAALGGILVTLTTALSFISAFTKRLGGSVKDITKMAGSFIAVAAAVLILSSAMKKLSGLSWEEIAKGLVSVGALVLELAIFFKVADLDNMGLLKGLGIMLLAESVNILARAVKKFAALSPMDLVKGLVGIGAVLTEVAALTYILGNSNHVVSSAAALAIIGVSLGSFVGAISNLGSMSWEGLAKGLVGMGGALLSIALAAKAMPTNMISVGVGITAIAVAMRILAPVVQGLGSMSWGDIAKGILTLGAALGTFAVAGAFINSLHLEVTLLALSGAITLFGVGVLAVGAGVLTFAMGISTLGAALSVSGAIIVEAIVSIIGSLLSLVPLFGQVAGEAIVAFVDAIANSAGSIINGVAIIGQALLDGIAMLVPSLVNLGLVIIVSILAGIANNIGLITLSALQIIAGFLNGIAAGMPLIIQAGINVVLAFLNSMADGIRGNGEAVFAAMRNLLSSLVELVLTALQNIVQGFPVIGQDLANALEEAKGSVREALAPESMTQIGSEAVQNVSNGITIATPSISSAADGVGTAAKDAFDSFTPTLSEVGGDWGSTLASGLSDAGANVDLTAYGISEDMLASLTVDGSGTGYDDILTFVNGVQSGEGDVTSAAGSITNLLGTGLNKNYSTQGSGAAGSYVSGVLSKKGSAKSAGDTMGSMVVSGFGSGSSNAYSTGAGAGGRYNSGILSQKSGSYSAGSSLGSSGASGAASQQGGFYSAGSNSGGGFISGLRSAISGAVSAAADFASRAVAAVKERLRINSPSKVFAEIGDGTVEGYVLGLHRSTIDAEIASRRLADDSVESMKHALGKVAASITDDIDLTPTISPVLDLSEIQNGSKKIQGILGQQDVTLNPTGMTRNNLNDISMGMNNSGFDVVTAINDLRTDVSKLSAAISADRDRDTVLYTNIHTTMDGREIASTLTDSVVRRINRSQVAKLKAVGA